MQKVFVIVYSFWLLFMVWQIKDGDGDDDDDGGGGVGVGDGDGDGVGDDEDDDDDYDDEMMMMMGKCILNFSLRLGAVGCDRAH